MAANLQFNPFTQLIREADSGRISGPTKGFLPRRSSLIDGSTARATIIDFFIHAI